jgi:soluble lytic murein transglycosylase-like protein
LEQPAAVRSDRDKTERTVAKHYPPSPPFGDNYKDRVGTEPLPNKLVTRIAIATARVTEPEYDAVRLNMGTGTELKGHSTGDSTVDFYIVDSSRRYNIDPLLIYAQMGQETSYKRGATSHKGASGLMQLMPATARRLGVTKIYDPQQNIEGGVKYIRMLLNMFGGNLNLALAGYNAGEGAVMKYGNQIPPYNETRDYVKRISARYRSMTLSRIAKNDRYDESR